jgi:hypothetical protein
VSSHISRLDLVAPTLALERGAGARLYKDGLTFVLYYLYTVKRNRLVTKKRVSPGTEPPDGDA